MISRNYTILRHIADTVFSMFAFARLKVAVLFDSCCLLLRPCQVRFDENLNLKEDYVLC